MSEFQCRNGHLMSCRDKFCPQCGATVGFMDGKTGRQCAAEEAWEFEQQEQERDDERFGEDDRDEDE